MRPVVARTVRAGRTFHRELGDAHGLPGRVLAVLQVRQDILAVAGALLEALVDARAGDAGEVVD